MKDLIQIHYDNADRPTVSGRELYEALEVKTAYKDWFPRMCEYGFSEGKDYCSFLSDRSDGKAGKPRTDHQLTIPMAKELCMLQRTDKGKQMKPKAEYFDELVDRNLLTGIRETAGELGVKQNQFVAFLLEKKYMYRDKKGKLTAYAKPLSDGLFERKECMNEKTQWKGTQDLVTPKGRETFRLLMVGA